MNRHKDIKPIHHEIDKDVYMTYLDVLLSGNRSKCSEIVNTLRDGEIPIMDIYQHLFQRSLYTVGELWEINRISVATEHMATSITEGLMNQIYPEIFSPSRIGKTVVVGTIENELHQVGSKMVADIFEMNGWDAHFLGAGVPKNELIRYIESISPDAVGLSMSVYFHLADLEKTLSMICEHSDNLKILVGGQAFRFGGEFLEEKYPGVQVIYSLDEVDRLLKTNLSR